MTKKKAKGPGGRPPLTVGEATVILTIRVSAEQKEKFARVGGAQRFREWLDGVKEAKA